MSACFGVYLPAHFRLLEVTDATQTSYLFDLRHASCCRLLLPEDFSIHIRLAVKCCEPWQIRLPMIKGRLMTSGAQEILILSEERF